MTAGSIVISLLLSTGSFSTDTNRAAKDLKRLQKEASEAGKVIGTAIVAGATAAVAALQLTINSMDDMSKAAQKVSASTEEFSKLTYAAGLADVSMETLVGSLGKLTKAQSAALKETSQQAKVFDALGISIKNADGSLRESTDVLSDFADKFQALKGSPEAMAAGFAIFGRSFQEMIPLLKDGGDGIRAAGDELEAFGGVLSTEAGNNAEEFNDNLTRLQTAAKALAQAVASDLLPDLIDLTNNWIKLAKDGSTLQDTAHGIADIFRVIGGVAEFVGGYFTALDNVIQGVTIGFVGLAEAAKGVINLNWDQVKRGIDVANGGADLAYYGTAPETATARNPRARAGSSRRGGAAMNYTPDYDPSAALRLALEDSSKPKGARKSGGGGKSDAEREAEQLQKSYESLRDSLNETNALFGKNTEAAKVLYETQSGGLAALSQPLKDELLQLAKRNDLQEENNEIREAADEFLKKESERIKEALASNDMLIEDLQLEGELMKLNNIDRERELALRALNKDATDEQRAAVAELAEENERMREQIDIMDDVRSAFKGFFEDVLTGNKSLKDSFKDLFQNISEMIAERIAQQWVDQLFGAAGTSGGGAAGGGGFDWGAMIGAFFGGGKAGGGDVFGKRAYLVGEQGPEMFVPRTAGTILPAKQTAATMGGSRGGLNQTNIYQVQGRIDRRARDDIASDVGRRASTATRRNGR